VTKLLLIVAFIIAIVLWLKYLARQRDELPRQEKSPEDMVRCEVCKVNLPRSEAVLSQGKFYCCDEHRRRAS
jgi:uncharacterized protein